MPTPRYSKGNWSKSELRKLKSQIYARQHMGPRAQEAARIEFMDAQTAESKQRQAIREQYRMAMPPQRRTD